MDYLLAKIRGRNGGLSMVLSDKTVFEDIPNFMNARAYDDDYKLQDGEWFVVDEFSSKSYCLDILQNNFNAAEYSNLPKKLYRKIAYVISVQEDEDGNEIYIFQNVTSSLLLSKQKFISFGPFLDIAVTGFTNTDQASFVNNENILVLKELPDCYYVKAEDKLYFRNLSCITSIFDGINELYNEATDEEVRTLFDLEMVNLGADFGTDKVKIPNRRKIKEALIRYNSFSDEKKQLLPTYVSKYCPTLFDEETQKFNINSEKELTELLNGMNQRYYTTEIDEEKRLANSITVVLD